MVTARRLLEAACCKMPQKQLAQDSGEIPLVFFGGGSPVEFLQGPYSVTQRLEAGSAQGRLWDLFVFEVRHEALSTR